MIGAEAPGTYFSPSHWHDFNSHANVEPQTTVGYRNLLIPSREVLLVWEKQLKSSAITSSCVCLHGGPVLLLRLRANTLQSKNLHTELQRQEFHFDCISSSDVTSIIHIFLLKYATHGAMTVTQSSISVKDCVTDTCLDVQILGQLLFPVQHHEATKS